MTEEMKQKAGFYGWTNVALLFFIYFVALGLVYYGFNVIFPAMIKTLGWGRGEASLAHSIRGLLAGLLTPVVALLINKKGARFSMIGGLSVLAVGLILLASVTSKLWQWTIIWGILMPIGFAFGGGLPIMTILTYWFEKNRATAMGVTLTGASIGGFIAQPFYTWVIEQTGSWQSGWWISGGFGIVAVVVAFWIRNMPSDMGQHPDGISPEETKAAADAGKSLIRTYRTPIEWKMRDAFKTRALYFIIVNAVGSAMTIYILAVHGVLHLTDKGFTAMQAASVLSTLVLFGGIARFPMGWLGDRVEPRWIMGVMFAIMFFSVGVIWQASSLVIILIGAGAAGLCYGSGVVLIPSMVGNYFGKTQFATIGAAMTFVGIIFGAIVPVGAGYIYDIYKSYDLAFMIIMAIILLGSVSIALAAPPIPKTKE